MLLYCNIWKMHFYNTRSFCSFSLYLLITMNLWQREFYSLLISYWTSFARTKAIFLKMVLCYKLQMCGLQWHSEAYLTTNRQLSKNNSLCECILSIPIKKKCQMAWNPMITFAVHWSVSDLWLRPQLCSVRHGSMFSCLCLYLKHTSEQIYNIQRF